jgi:SAM-dependent methyltransferase
MSNPSSCRAENEIAHGQMLAKDDPERIWGWGTPAGAQRAQRRANLIASGAGLKPGMRVLEIGCGTGMFTSMFARSGAQIVAVDISPDLLARARQRGLPEAQVRFLERRFEECDVEGPFDAVIGSSVLHHLDYAVALKKIMNLLKPDGWLSFAEPNLLNPQVFLERTLHFLPMFSYVSPDETAFVRWRLGKLMRAVGLVDVQITPFDWLHPSTPRFLMGLVKGAGRVLEFLPGVREFSGSLYVRGRRPAQAQVQRAA